MNGKELITKFYEAFAIADTEAMVSHYDANIIFNDPAFGELKGEEAKNMWRMLINRNKGSIKISFDNVFANENTSVANWVAVYIFSQTGRKVVNKIKAEFVFENGIVIKHTDHFNLWRWTQQALGWSGFMRNKIQNNTRTLLTNYTKI